MTALHLLQEGAVPCATFRLLLERLHLPATAAVAVWEIHLPDVQVSADGKKNNTIAFLLENNDQFDCV